MRGRIVGARTAGRNPFARLALDRPVTSFSEHAFICGRRAAPVIASSRTPLLSPTRMQLHTLDVSIIVGYFVVIILLGLWVSRRGVKDLDGYFLGGKSLPWYLLGISDASGMFDISGTMWLVFILFLYGLKSIWLPWLWPTFNQIFLMMFMSAWMRRSNVLTGAEWIETRFGRARGATLAHLSVVVFALINVIGLLAYAFKGIGKFAVVMLPWHFTGHAQGILGDENIYAVIILWYDKLMKDARQA